MERVKVMVSLFTEDGRCLITHEVHDAGIGDLVSLMYLTWQSRSLDAVSMNVNIEQKGLKK